MAPKHSGLSYALRKLSSRRSGSNSIEAFGGRKFFGTRSYDDSAMDRRDEVGDACVIGNDHGKCLAEFH